MMVQWFVQPVLIQDPQELVEEGEKRHLPGMAVEGYETLLAAEPYNARYHFQLLRTYFYADEAVLQEYEIAGDDVRGIIPRYRAHTRGKTQEEQDIGHLGLSTVNYFLNDYQVALYHLLKIRNDTLPNLNLVSGKVMEGLGEYEKAIEYYTREINYKGNVEDGYISLSSLLSDQNRKEELQQLLVEKEARKYVPIGIQRKVFFQQMDLPAYFGAIIKAIARKIDLLGFLGAFLILAVWVMYLVKIDMYEKEKWYHLLFTLLAGAVFALPAFYLHDFNRLVLGYELNGQPLHDFIYCVVGIGMVEELVKIIPFLLIMRFTKILDEPIDFLVYASLAALGFSFTENLLYFTPDELDVIHSRALLSSVSHMFDSSIIAYGFVLARFRHHKRSWPYFLIFFALAALAHGFYDYWLIADFNKYYILFTILFWASSLYMYSSLLNNALNHSPFFTQEVLLDTGKLLSYLFASLLGVFMFQYVAMSIFYGPDYGQVVLRNSFISGGFLLIFLSFNMSNFRIRRNKWMPVRFFTSHITADADDPVGLHVELHSLPKHDTLEDLLPAKGNITGRINISGEDRWYLVQLNEMRTFGSENFNQLLVRNPQNKILLMDENKLPVFLMLPRVPLPMAGGDFRISDFHYLGQASIEES